MKLKAKGLFLSSNHDVEHNPTSNIIVDSVIEYFISSTPVKQTILTCVDIRGFISVRTVKGEAQKDGNHIGKVVRWYYSTATKTAIHYKTSNNMVPKSQNGMPIMDLPDDYSLPEDLDYEPYIKEAEELLATINVPAKANRNKRVAVYTQMGLSIVPWPHKGVTVSKPGFDFSSTGAIGIQTGHRASTIAIKRSEPTTLTMGEWSFYYFNDPRYPGALKTVSKKMGFEVMYGGTIEFTEVPCGTLQPLPLILMNAIFNNLGLAQRRKVVDGLEFLL